MSAQFQTLDNLRYKKEAHKWKLSVFKKTNKQKTKPLEHVKVELWKAKVWDEGFP